jgi:ABC-type transport system substrate-binding protein
MRSLRSLLQTLAALAATTASLMATAAMPDAADGAASTDVHAPVALQEGTWDADITFFDPATGVASGHAKGVQVNRRLSNGHWITNDFQVLGSEAQSRPRFEGHGVWGWDPVAREYIDTWVDTNDGAVRTDHGFWNAEQRTLYWTALQPDGQGHTVNYRMTEVYAPEGRRTLTFFQVAMQSGRLVKLAEMVFTRR